MFDNAAIYLDYVLLYSLTPTTLTLAHGKNPFWHHCVGWKVTLQMLHWVAWVGAKLILKNVFAATSPD